jgi:hypothetical protein
MELFPSDNEWDVPTLRLDMQARVVAPVMPWGSRDRRSAMHGTWTFYADDYRFSALAKDPVQVLLTGCKALVEMNFTCFEQTPRAEVLWATYRKRSIARQWQEAGLPVFADLNVPERHRELCLLGVPQGWRSFATRGYAARPEALRREHQRALEFAGSGLLMLVHGGGPKIEEMCRSLPGAVYAPSYWETVE